ncbi:MAG: diguanylate cyclase [Proteobacteria bacterium]|nr:diguanylate cyclase [Pseudomonadota bacterium]
MTKKNALGWIYAAATALIWAAYSNVLKIANVYFDNINPIVFILQSLIIASFSLLVISGAGRLSWNTVKNSTTWIYGTAQILNNVCVMGSFAFAISATSLSLLSRMGIIIAALIAGLTGKNVFKKAKLGFVFILLGLLTVGSGIESSNKGAAIFLIFLACIFQVIQARISKNHKENNSATGDVKTELRVMGYVLSITSTTYVLFLLLASVLNLETLLPNILPSKEEILSIQSLGLAVFTGIFIISAMKYCEFYATKTIGVSNFLVMVAFSPVFTVIIEYLLDFFGVLDARAINLYDGIGGLIIIVGVLLKVRSEFFTVKKSQKLAPKARQDLDVLRDTIKTAYICFDDDSKKVSKTLGYSEKTLSNIMRLDKPVPKTTRNKIVMNHARHIASLDILTGALNKHSLDLRLKDLKNRDKALVAFIDLDKFKPVNDTHGHEAGDSLLKGIAERLMDEFSAPHVVARLGGDEYCLIIYGIEQQDEMRYAAKIKNIVSSPFIVEGVKEEITVGCSVGVAHYPSEATCGLKLQKVADKRMYKDKKKNGGGR